MDHVDFRTLRLGWKPNQFLAAPADFEMHAEPHDTVQDFPLSIDDLEKVFRRVVAAHPRIAVVRDDPSNRQIDVVQRSALFGFPDTITVQFVERGEGRSSCIIYSRSTYGIGDMGVNKKRVQGWLAELARLASQA